MEIGLTQSIAWPGLYAARKDYLKAQLKYSELNTEVMNANIRKDVRTAYYQLWFLQDKNLLLKSLDSIYTNLFNTTQVRVRTGDVAKLDQIAADAQLKQLKAYVEQNNKEIVIQQQQLMVLLNRNEWILPIDEPLQKLETNLYDENNVHPVLQLQQQNVSVAAANIKIQKKSNLPEFSARVFSQRLYGVSDPFTGFSVSVGFPLFGAGAYKNKVNVANKEKEVQENLLSYQTQVMATDKKSAIAEMEKNMALLSFFETSGLQQAKDITEAASQSYRSGDISFAELSQFLTQAINIRQNYLDVLNSYNHSAIQYNYLNNK